MERWARGVHVAQAGVERIAFVEDAAREVNGPFGTSRVRTVHAVAVRPGERDRPERRPLRAEVDGEPAWRLALRLPQTDRPGRTVEEVTLWLSRGADTAGAPVLLRSRVAARAGPGGTIRVLTDYAPVEGPGGTVSVPQSRRTDATFQQRRRWRTFTVPLSADVAFEDLEVTRRP